MLFNRRYISLIIIVVWSTLLFFVFNNDLKLNSSKNIENILNHWASDEQSILENWLIENNLPDELLENSPDSFWSNILLDSFDINDIEKWIGNPSLDQLLPLYKKQKNPEILRYIIQKAIDNYEFETALSLLAGETLDYSLKAVWIETYIFLMFNEARLDYSRINRIKEILAIMYDSWYITSTQLNHYNGLVALSRWDIDNWMFFLDEVGDDKEFISWNIETQESVKKSNSYKDVPDYYLESLLGSVVYRKQYVRISQKIALDIISDGNGYILPHQLSAYSSLILRDYTQSQESLQRLLENDVSQKELYNFLMWIVFYEQEEYAQAVFQFQTLWTSKYFIEGQKYLFLIYQKIEDKPRLIRLMQEIIVRWDISNEEYIWFFDELFRNDIENTEYYVRNMTSDIDTLMEMCYTKADYKQICMYWKAWLFYQLWQYENAYKYLSKVVDSVYNTRVFIHLAEISKAMWNEVLAKKRYVRALRVSDNNELSLSIRNSLWKILDSD